MANKVIQLEDKAGNNLYPLAGGMAANSVTTAMLQDGAVTADKLDSGILGTTESYTIATNNWTSLASSAPYTYSATVTSTTTIGNDTIVHLLNDQPVAFANYGFAVGAVNGQSVTIYSIGQPSTSVTLKINYRESA